MICGSTASDEAVPMTISNSSRRYLSNGHIRRPDRRITRPRINATNATQVR
ncbi:hypothetical protein D3C86_2101670 [compost metagenome]